MNIKQWRIRTDGLNKFGDVKSCPKCGATREYVVVEWQGNISSQDGGGDYMECKCTCCKFYWFEMCLDWKDKAAQES